jgi:hypothetical protein
VYAFGLTLLQLLSGSPTPDNLVQRAQSALESVDVRSSFLDVAAGAWDVRIAQRVMKLGLWCAMAVPENRPAIGIVAAELSRLVPEARLAAMTESMLG